MEKCARFMIVAIDGPAGAGKSTVAKAIAAQFGFQHIDSGAMYRAVALAARDQGAGWKDADGLARVAARIRIEFEGARILLEGLDVTQEIRTPEIAQGASIVASVPGVRDALTGQQRALARRGDVVMDGRDIGTVVFPHAELKLYLDAATDERAERRYHDLESQGRHPSLPEVRQELELRDQRDKTRATAPLRPAPDAVILDTTKLPVEEVIQRVAALIRERQRPEVRP
jgi:cytidylate kinase